MSDPIFRDQNEPEEKPTDYIANPVRVQLSKSEGGRHWTRMDLVALANNILERERAQAEMYKEVRALSIRLSGVNSQLEALSNTVESLNARLAYATTGTLPLSGKLRRMLSAIEEIANEEPDEDDDDDGYDPH